MLPLKVDDTIDDDDDDIIVVIMFLSTPIQPSHSNTDAQECRSIASVPASLCRRCPFYSPNSISYRSCSSKTAAPPVPLMPKVGTLVETLLCCALELLDIDTR
jgi:hypothetical protein